MNPTDTNFLEWETLEYQPQERNSDWFWIVGAVAVVIIVISIALGDLLLGVIMLIGTLSLFMYELRAPREIRVKITDKGVQVQNELYPYEKIKSFWIDETKEHLSPMLIIHYERPFLPNIHIHLENISVETVRDRLTNYGILEDKHEPNLIEALSDFFGF